LTNSLPQTAFDLCPADSPSAWLVDDLAYSVARTEFEAKALRVLKLARAALMYLSLGMQREEKRRATKKDKALIAPMTPSPWEDNWKLRFGRVGS